MNSSHDPVIDRIESANRMLVSARTEHNSGHDEDAQEFLAAARRNIDRAAEALKNAAPVVELRKEVARAR